MKNKAIPFIFQRNSDASSPPIYERNSGMAKPDTSAEQLIPMDYDKNILSLKKKKRENIESNREKNQISNAYILFCVFAFEYFFVSIFNLWLSPYISIYHYIFVFYLFTWFYI